MTVNPGYTVVTDLQTAGAIIWWRLEGETDVGVLTDAWAACHLDPALLPDNPSPQVALSRAAYALATKRRLVRPLAGHRGWALVDETATPEGLAYQTAAQISLYEGGLALKNETLNTHEKVTLELAFERAQTKLTVNDISAWLSKLVRPQLRAVSLRDTGGVYFVPRERVDQYRTLVKAISRASAHRLYEVPALKSEDAIDAILDAVLGEADHECGSMERELDDGALQGRALHTRALRCDAMREKVEAYEALLGRGMVGVKDRIEALKASVVAAELAATMEQQQS